MSQRQDEPASLTVRNIAIQRGARMVMRDFSMEARTGDIVWLRGSNGQRQDQPAARDCRIAAGCSGNGGAHRKAGDDR